MDAMSTKRWIVLPLSLVSTMLIACGGEPTGPTGGTQQGPSSPSGPSVSIAPGTDTLGAIGAERDFSADLVRSDGSSAGDGEATWTSTEENVATVDGNGLAHAHGEGTTRIVAALEGAADTAMLVIHQVVAAVRVTPDPDTLAAMGGTTELEVEMEDANGHPVDAATVTWSSSDTTVATVDNNGLVTGRAIGESQISASANGTTGLATVAVIDPPGNQAPAVEIQAPESGASFTAKDTINFQGTASDIEEGTLTGQDLVWRSNLEGQIGTGETLAVTDFVEGEHTISLTATDGGGASAADTISMVVLAPANLVIGQLRIHRRGVLTSEPVEAGAVIYNLGAIEVDAFDWEFTVEGSVRASGRAGPVASLDSVIIDRQDLGTVPAGRHALTVWVDTGDEVAEGNEEDNSWSNRVLAYPSGFNIELDFVSAVDSVHEAVFRQAASRWEDVVTGDLPDITFSSPENLEWCADGAGTRSAPIDDLLILVRVDSIDGPGETLGQAGPCAARQTSGGDFLTSVLGNMTFDEADLDQLAGEGLLEETILHEMGHVLGIGTLWSSHGLLVGEGSSDPFYVGPAGRSAFRQIGGDSYTGSPVPVANTGEEGTRDAHWREAVLDSELMTGFLNNTSNPLSLLTVESLGDQYYPVDPSAADAFSIPTAALRAGQAPSLLHLGDDLLEIPVRGIGPKGIDINVQDTPMRSRERLQ